MGGQIWVESEPRHGSIFHFTANLGIGKPLTAAAATNPSVDLHNLPAMVIDDNETNRRILRETLLSWDMRPTLVEGAREALAILRHAHETGKPFPLVITDMQMPDMDGFDWAGQIKQNPVLAGATIMMLTSAGLRGDGARCRQLGVKAYLTKPVKQSDLREAITTSLSAQVQPKGGDLLITRHSLREARPVLRILLAEDNQVNQILARRLLEQRGHIVVVANNGLEVLARLETATLAPNNTRHFRDMIRLLAGYVEGPCVQPCSAKVQRSSERAAANLRCSVARGLAPYVMTSRFSG